MNIEQVLTAWRPHPRILFNEIEIDAIKGRVNRKQEDGKIDFKSLWGKALELANDYAAETGFTVAYPSCNRELTITLPLKQLEPVGDPPGYVDFPFWTMYSRAVEERIKILSFAYGMTGDARFAEKVKEYLLALAKFSRWYEFPHRGAEGNLSNAHFTLGAAIGYDAIFHMLSDSEKTIIKESLITKGLEPFTIDFDNHDSHNIIASKQVAMLVGSLAVMDEECMVRVEPFLKNSYGYILRYLDNRLQDPEIEGLLYLNVAARHILMASDILQRATGNSTFISHAYFKTLPDLFLYMMGTGGKSSFVNFSDSFYELDISYLMAVLASTNHHEAASWYVHEFTGSKLDTLLYLKSIPHPQGPSQFYKNQMSSVFPIVGWTALRSGWEKEDHFLAFVSSSSAKDHNHFDQNNFVLHVAGEWLLTNPGYQDYVEGPRREFTLGTVGHNSLLVNGLGQTKRGNSRMVDSFLSSPFSYVTGDASGAYDGKVAEWHRTIAHLDSRFYVLVDRVAKDQPKDTISFLYHTTSTIAAEGKTLAPGDRTNAAIFDIIGQESSVSLYTFSPNGMEKEIKQYPGAEQYGSYIEVSADSGSSQVNQVTVMIPHHNKNAVTDRAFSGTVHGSTVLLKVENPSGGTSDYVLINGEEMGQKETEDTPASLTGEFGWVSWGQGSDRPEKLAILNGSLLKTDGQTWVWSEKNITLTATFQNGMDYFYIGLKDTTKVSITSPKPKDIIVNGASIPIQYDLGHGTVQLDLEQGQHEVMFIY
ncbi:heparinase II/III domain-containing protein [Neobacillus sp. Marseille-QA0830]